MDDPQLSRQLEEEINANMTNQQMNKKTMENNIVIPDISYEGQEAKDLLTTITNDIFTEKGEWQATNITPPSNIDQRQGNNPDFMDFDVEAEPLDKVKVTLSMAQLKRVLELKKTIWSTMFIIANIAVMQVETTMIQDSPNLLITKATWKNNSQNQGIEEGIRTFYETWNETKSICHLLEQDQY